MNVKVVGRTGLAAAEALRVGEEEVGAKADQAAAAEMQKMSAGLPLPPGFKMPF